MHYYVPYIVTEAFDVISMIFICSLNTLLKESTNKELGNNINFNIEVSQIITFISIEASHTYFLPTYCILIYLQ